MYVSELKCRICSATYDSEVLVQLCACGAPLLQPGDDIRQEW